LVSLGFPSENTAKVVPARAARAHRHKVFLPVVLNQAGSTTRVHLLDISRTGARANVPHLPPVGDRVRIVWNDIIITGRIAWVRDTRIGIRFDLLLSDSQIETIVAGK
jgi:hypothetical protein